jgi:hypothetical protein
MSILPEINAKTRRQRNQIPPRSSRRYGASISHSKPLD